MAIQLNQEQRSGLIADTIQMIDTTALMQTIGSSSFAERDASWEPVQAAGRKSGLDEEDEVEDDDLEEDEDNLIEDEDEDDLEDDDEEDDLDDEDDDLEDDDDDEEDEDEDEEEEEDDVQ